jgi:hypothetical protein
MLWDAVQWSLASQIADLFKLSETGGALLTDTASPESFFAELRKAGALDDALAFMGLALPRRMAIAWGRECVLKTGREVRLRPADTVALSAVAAWLEDPSDERRWVAYEAANNAELESPEALLALAVFLSGGSISPPGTPQPVPAAPELTGKLVGGAVTLAAVRVQPQLIADTKAAFLDRGERYAIGSSA